MTTKAQINANRTNAKRSTGPKTPQGKAAASQNSIKHGLLARSNVIASESQDEFDLHRDLLLEELAPATPMESVLAERIVSLSWRLKRTETLHTKAFDELDQRANHDPLANLSDSFLPKALQRPKIDPNRPELDLSLGKVALRDFANGRVLDRLLMYERRMENSLYKAMQELQKLKLIKKMQNEPNSTSPARPARGEAESKPAKSAGLRDNLKNMQNEPNLKNPQKSITSYPTSNYGKSHRSRQPKNKPNSNPIQPDLRSQSTQIDKRKTPAGSRGYSKTL